MKITIEKDDNTVEVFQNITDCYIAIKQDETVYDKKNGRLSIYPVSRSYSWGNNLREIAKEIYQSYFEIQEVLKDKVKN